MVGAPRAAYAAQINKLERPASLRGSAPFALPVFSPAARLIAAWHSKASPSASF